MTHQPQEPAWLHGHAHEPNPAPPSPKADFVLVLSNGQRHAVTPADLACLPRQEIVDCYIISTGHGTSGPFCFGGVTLRTLLSAYMPQDFAWQHADVVSGDGFGNRVLATEVSDPDVQRPFLLADTIDGRPLTREKGLVRLIVPDEVDDALRQVKWVAEIRIA